MLPICYGGIHTNSYHGNRASSCFVVTRLLWQVVLSSQSSASSSQSSAKSSQSSALSARRSVSLWSCWGSHVVKCSVEYSLQLLLLSFRPDSLLQMHLVSVWGPESHLGGPTPRHCGSLRGPESRHRGSLRGLTPRHYASLRGPQSSLCSYSTCPA